MKIALAFNFAITLMWFSSINAQIEDQNVLLTDLKKNLEVPFEKVYLHLDRPYYSAGDDIWIKAYLVDAMTNELSVNSTNLNIELISPGLKIIKRTILRVENGTVTGDMHLEDSIASGNYMIRAYTTWMRNFGDAFFFKKEIVIENQRDIKSLNQHYTEESNQNVDVQFFPESGPLIENVSALLGFKAVNSSGYGVDITGKVFSSLGDTATSFASTHLGMGSFFFLPKKGLKYFATGFTRNKVPFRVELPTASETGYSLKASDINKDYFRVTIKTNQETLGKFPLNKLMILGTSHNSPCITANVKVRMIDTPVILPKKEFPEGVALITLLDTSGRTYCERLYYVNKKENYRLKIIPDHEVYAPRQKVTLQISVTDSTDYPVFANLSVSVVDGNQITGFEKKPDITSYLLLESEIRGYIEQPFNYFDTTISGRFQALDNLLLTQGWRNFVWKSIPDTVNNFKYPVEEGITVSGRLRHVLSDRPISGSKISMVMAGDVKTFYKFSQTDSTGKYYFEGLNFTGPQNLMLYATDKKEKGVGMISLDSIFMEPAPINLNDAQKSETTVKNIPANSDEPNLFHISEYIEISNYRKEAEQKYNILKKYHLTDTIGLNEVKIIARKSSKGNSAGHIRLYNSPDYSLKVTEQMTTTHPDVIQTLQGRVAGLYITGDWINGYKFILHGQTGEPLFLIDGKRVDYASIITLPMNAIDQVEVIKDGGKLALYGFSGSFGVISVFTKRGINGSFPPVLNFISQRVYGYYQARTFYTPKYDVKKPEYEKPDLRTTIHWEPNLVTDEDGKATISFFNSDSKTILKVDVEGIAEPGIPLSGKTSFEVK
jgi:hypothetical protein